MRPFLTAEWRWLVMLNYRVDRRLLEPMVPRGCQLDLFHGEALISVVGFLFQNTRVQGIAVPYHREFAEVNLRFYVTPLVDGATRRGVVFVKEICPRHAVTWIARTLYNENYVTLPMRHSCSHPNRRIVPGVAFTYEWRHRGQWRHVQATADSTLMLPAPGSLNEFIAEHYWGYSTSRRGDTLEYAVEHVPWHVAATKTASFDCDVAGLYGTQFVEPLSGKPVSAFIADGSPVAVYPGRRLGAHASDPLRKLVIAEGITA